MFHNLYMFFIVSGANHVSWQGRLLYLTLLLCCLCFATYMFPALLCFSLKSSFHYRRFQPVLVPEPTVDETYQILLGLRERYEAHHKLRYTDESLDAAAKYSSQYISDRFLPDKAIDLIDEAGSRVRLRHAQLPEEAREFDKELKALLKEKDAAVRSATIPYLLSFEPFLVAWFRVLCSRILHASVYCVCLACLALAAFFFSLTCSLVVACRFQVNVVCCRGSRSCAHHRCEL